MPEYNMIPVIIDRPKIKVEMPEVSPTVTVAGALLSLICFFAFGVSIPAI